MPCIEVLSEIPSGLSVRSSNPRMLCKHFKTTVAHFVTGAQMLAMIQDDMLFDWMDIARDLLRDRAFAVSEAQADACKYIKFRNQELNHVNELRILTQKQVFIDLELYRYDLEIEACFLTPP